MSWLCRTTRHEAWSTLMWQGIGTYLRQVSLIDSAKLFIAMSRDLCHVRAPLSLSFSLHCLGSPVARTDSFAMCCFDLAVSCFWLWDLAKVSYRPAISINKQTFSQLHICVCVCACVCVCWSFASYFRDSNQFIFGSAPIAFPVCLRINFLRVLRGVKHFGKFRQNVDKSTPNFADSDKNGNANCSCQWVGRQILSGCWRDR